jgi:hypothetical protein
VVLKVFKRFIVLVPILAACGGDDNSTGPGSRPVATVSVSPFNSTLGLGLTETLVASPRDDSGNLISGVTITWSSSNSQIASVNSAGVVTAKAVGTVSITASAEGKDGTASVTVSQTPPAAPQLIFSTYLGGSQQDQVRDIATDAAGNIYVAGGTASTNFPATGGTLDQSFNGTYDVYVAKLSPSGTLLWATYLGGPNYDRAYAIEVDAQGYIYIAGRAGAGFPVTGGAFQTSFQGSPNDPPYGPQDGFVCKLTPAGEAIVFCSYFGTSDHQIVRDIAVDPQGGIYLGSSSSSGTFPAAWFANGYRSSPIGGLDGVVAKISNDGSQVLWATYVGGTADEAGEASIRVNAAGEPYVLYTTGSADAPTPNGFDHSLGGGRDAYLVKFSASGASLLFGTFVGGSAGESVETHELVLDPQGNPIISTGTTSSDFPTTPGAFQRTFGGTGGPSTGQGTNYGGDVFVAKISANGSQLLAATYVGGSEGEGAEGIGVDAQGNVYISGATYSSGLTFMLGGRQPILGGDADLFAIKLAPDLSRILYGTYLGGTDQDYGRTATATASGDFLIGGNILSTNWPVQSPLQGSPGGSLDGVVAKFR